MPIPWAMRPPWTHPFLKYLDERVFQRFIILAQVSRCWCKAVMLAVNRLFNVYGRDSCNNWMWLLIWKRSKGRKQVHPLFAVCSTVCKVTVGLLSSCRYIYNSIFTFLMFATPIQTQKLRGEYMSAKDMFCSQLCCASINTSMILFHSSSTRNARMKT